MTFFQRHPKIHAALHWATNGVAFILATQDQLLAATQLVPEGSKIPRYIGYALATLSFSKILLGRAQAAGGETGPVPATEDALATMVPSTGVPVAGISAPEPVKKAL